MRAGRVIGWAAAVIILIGSLIMLSALHRKLEAMKSVREAPEQRRESRGRTTWRASAPPGERSPAGVSGATGADGPTGPAGSRRGLPKGIPPGAIW